MFVSFARRTAQGTTASGSLENVPAGAAFETTLGARMVVGNKDAADIFLLTGCQELEPGLSDCTVRTLGSWGISTLSADLSKNLALAASDLPQKKKKKSPANLWGMKRHSRPQPGVQTLLGSSAFHFEGTKDGLLCELQKLLPLREQVGTRGRPIVVWEPGFMSLDDLRQALPLADIVSFSGGTLASIFGIEAELDKNLIESHAKELLAFGVGPSGKGIVMVHCDEEHLTGTRDDCVRWTPTFYTKDGHKEIHRIGTSSVFVGAFAARFVQTGVVAEAALSGAVAESFAQEQPGLPRRDLSPFSSAAEDYAHVQYGLPRGRTADGEVWNMDGFEARVQQLRGRMEADRQHVQVLRRRLSGETMVEG